MSQEEKNKDPMDFKELLAESDGVTSFVWDDEELLAEEEVTRAVVSFRLGDDRFSVAGELVREILGEQEVTFLPGAPGHIRGITILRRQVVALLSLREFLNLPGEENLAGMRTIIVETPHFMVGLLVDEVTGLGDWPESAIDPDQLPDNLRASTARYARGAHFFASSLHIFLDLHTLLEDAALQ